MLAAFAAFHGAKKLDHACFAQPGERMFRCVWSTSLACAVVPEVR